MLITCRVPPDISCRLSITWHANLFHFINNMAAWHFSCRTDYNTAWLEETGPVTEAEDRALEVYRKVVREHAYNETWPGKAFVAIEDASAAWQECCKLLGCEKTAALREVFHVFEPRFQAIWAKDESRLERRAEELVEFLEREETGRAVRALEFFFGTRFPDVMVHLLISRGRGTAGGANEGPGHVTLEVLETEDLRHAVETFLHEAAHLMEVAAFHGMYKEFAESHGLSAMKSASGWDAYHLIKEAITGSLLPGGCISSYLGLDVTDWKDYASKCRSSGALGRADLAELTALCMPIVKKHVSSGRRVDVDLLVAVYGAFTSRDWDSLKGGRE